MAPVAELGRDLCRCRRLASALSARGIGRGDTVAVMAPNMPAMFEAHFGVPMTGAVLNALNTRLDAEAIAFILDHGEAKVLIADREFSRRRSSKALAHARRARPLVDRHRRSRWPRPASASARSTTRQFLADGDPELRLALAGGRMGRDRAELHLGHHRQSQGRRLSPSRRLPERASATSLVWAHAAPSGLSVDPADVPLQRLVLPVDAWPRMAGTHVCLRRVEPRPSSTPSREHGVTHLCGAPIVHGHADQCDRAEQRPRRPQGARS